MGKADIEIAVKRKKGCLIEAAFSLRLNFSRED